MPITVNIPDIGKVNFPDGMAPEDIQKAIETDILKTSPPETSALTSVGKALAKGSGAAAQMAGGSLELGGRQTLHEQPLTETDVQSRISDQAARELQFKTRMQAKIRGFRPGENVANLPPPTEAEVAKKVQEGSVSQWMTERMARNEMQEQQDMLRLTGNVNNPLERAAARYKIATGKFIQTQGEAALNSELYADPYHDKVPIDKRLKERPFETIFVEGAKQAPNLVISLAGGAFGARFGISPYITAGGTSFLIERGDIFQEGKEFLIEKYKTEDQIPDSEWSKLVSISKQHGAFNGLLDSLTPGSQIARAMVGKAIVRRLMSKEGLKYIGKEIFKDLAKELLTELTQEESTMLAGEKMGKSFTPEEKMQRRLAVVAGVVLPTTGASVGASVSNIQRTKKTPRVEPTLPPGFKPFVPEAPTETPPAGPAPVQPQPAPVEQPKAPEVPVVGQEEKPARLPPRAKPKPAEEPPVPVTEKPAATAPEKKAEQPGMIAPGEQIYSQSGRKLAPAPNFALDTDRRVNNAIRKVDAWLLDEAKKEAEATGNDFVATTLKAINLKNVSQADRDTLNLVVFGSPDGPTAQHRKASTPAPEAPRGAIPAITGRSSKVSTATGTEIDTDFAVVEADTMIPSHKEGGVVNPDFPAELQPRDRTRAASRMQINAIAKNLKPELLGDSGKASDGAPIIGPDGVVESGNARTLALQMAYRGEKGPSYKEWLSKNAANFGLDPSQIGGMKQPVLVRIHKGGKTMKARAFHCLNFSRTK